MAVVLIGPVAVGKSTVGALLAPLLGREFVDLDEFATDSYATSGQSIDALIEHAKAHGFVAAHRWWQPARLQAAREVLQQHPDAVIAFGAGHSHFEDDGRAAEVATLLEPHLVVFLLPCLDPEEAVGTLRARCIAERGDDQDWLFDDVDFLGDWVRSAQHHALADVTVTVDGRTPHEVAVALAETCDRLPE